MSSDDKIKILKAKKEKIESLDTRIAHNYGPIVEQLPSRRILDRKIAYTYILLTFYRRLMFAFIIIVTDYSPTTIMIMVL